MMSVSASSADAMAVSVASVAVPPDAIVVAAEVVEVVEEKPPEKPVRRFPPPCWTQEETLALIDAYRERWYALRRGYLRTADWDAVAATVTSKCPNASPAKTSAQCRHKMEKLRQRYRAEKQRSLTYPTGRFFSSWFFFENMDAMENGVPVQDPENPDVSGNGARFKTFLDPGSLKLKLNNKKGSKLDGDLASSYGYRGINSSAKNGEVKVNSALNGYSSYMDMGSEKDEEEMDFRGGGVGQKMLEDGLYGAPVYKVKNFANAFVNPRTGFDGIDEASMPPRIRMKRTERVMSGGGGYDMMGNDQVDPKESLWASMGLKKKYGMEFDLLQSRGMNGFNGVPKMGFEKRMDGGGSGGEGKRGRSAIDDMVSAIKMLGEGFVKMETMKMDMAREIEKNRMEMEVKRNEMILESQRQIVDALAKGLMEVKRKKPKTSPAPET